MKRNLWPYAIVLYFVVFITGMAAWIGFAVRNDHQLVRKDYYEQELKYQNELESFGRAAAGAVVVAYEPKTHLVTIQLPSDAAGTIYFYRPSDLKLDRQVPLSTREGIQQINVGEFDPGLWKVRLTWTANGAEFRHDEKLVL